jgi:hypothetical protein
VSEKVTTREAIASKNISNLEEDYYKKANIPLKLMLVEVVRNKFLGKLAFWTDYSPLKKEIVRRTKGANLLQVSNNSLTSPNKSLTCL